MCPIAISTAGALEVSADPLPDGRRRGRLLRLHDADRPSRTTPSFLGPGGFRISATTGGWGCRCKPPRDSRRRADDPAGLAAVRWYGCRPAVREAGASLDKTAKNARGSLTPYENTSGAGFEAGLMEFALSMHASRPGPASRGLRAKRKTTTPMTAVATTTG